MANSVDPDQTAPSGAVKGTVWSGSALFAYVILSNFGVWSLRTFTVLLVFAECTWHKAHFCTLRLALLLQITWFLQPKNVDIFLILRDIIWCITHEKVPFADNACPYQPARPYQPAHLHRLIFAFVARIQNRWILQYMLTNWECLDQTAWMCMLIWTYVVHRLYNGPFRALHIMWYYGELRKCQHSGYKNHVCSMLSVAMWAIIDRKISLFLNLGHTGPWALHGIYKYI